jgi:hypothetical protein
MLLRLETTGWVLRVGSVADQQVRALSGLESESKCPVDAADSIFFNFKQTKKQGCGLVSNKQLFEEVRTDVEHGVSILRDVDWCGSPHVCRMKCLSGGNSYTIRVLPADLVPADDVTIFSVGNWKSFAKAKSSMQAHKAWMQCAEGKEFSVTSENGRLVLICNS